jgi:peptidoglycan/xylan/chitin deacetylase (PgdA/CDA1 family)
LLVGDARHQLDPLSACGSGEDERQGAPDEQPANHGPGPRVPNPAVPVCSDLRNPYTRLGRNRDRWDNRREVHPSALVPPFRARGRRARAGGLRRQVATRGEHLTHAADDDDAERQHRPGAIVRPGAAARRGSGPDVPRDREDSPGAPYPDLFVSPDDFARQIAWLAAHGYRAVTLRRVYDNWHQGTWLPAHPIVVSFDDGYRSQYTAALPILRARHWPAVLNLTVDHEDDFWGLPPRLVRALIDAGWELDSHTLTHPDLTGLGDTDLHHEVAGSRAALRHQFGVPVDFFCYPSGRFDERVVGVVKAAGYLGATSTRYGLARPGDLYWLARVRVNGSDGLAGFAAKLRALARR